MRRIVYVLGVAFALALLAQPADAQLKFGAQLGTITSVDDPTLDGQFGLGARAMIDPPLLPLGGFVSATYWFPDDEGFTEDLSYWTATAAAQLRLPLPTVKPYALAGWQLRRASLGDESESENGPVVGLGVQFDFMMSLFLEGTFEFNDELEGVPDFDNNPFVIKGGILFGGGA